MKGRFIDGMGKPALELWGGYDPKHDFKAYAYTKATNQVSLHIRWGGRAFLLARDTGCFNL